MRLFAIADPHLSRAVPKPMDIFGPGWQGHPAAFFDGWRRTVGEDDLVLVPGDISWAMRFEDAMLDLRDLAELPGRKVLLRGNHDYWWPSISRLRRELPRGMWAVQNDAVAVGGAVVSGTRGWVCPGSHGFTAEDQRIYDREVERLRLSLAHAAKLEGAYRVVMLHFPPTNARLEPSELTDLILAAKPDALVFGHVHGEEPQGILPRLGDVNVHFVAADALRFEPKLIAELPRSGTDVGVAGAGSAA
ncbi:MAG: metallophosphoesterase [Trueperaceae bacterium]|nr:metallophosphoesterase [Trueperaceae bacterium]